MEWIWGSTDKPRAARALKVKVVAVDTGDTPSIDCEGSDGARYHSTLSECTCPDFIFSRQKGKNTACKHMVRLAMILEFLNENGLTPHDQFLSDYYAREELLAKYAWHYYVLGEPLVSDAEYDSLKSEYMEWRNAIKGALPSPDTIPAYDAALKRLLDAGSEYVDKTANGGSLYFFDEQIADSLKKDGYIVSYAPGGTRSTKHRAAWFVK